MSLSAVEAAKTLKARRAARADVCDYASFIDVPGRPVEDDDGIDAPIESKLATHHFLILKAIDRCSKTPGGRLMIFCPPGSAKSTYASVVFPSYYLGANSRKKLILASYGDTLAVKIGRRTRGIVKQLRYASLFSTGLTNESAAANNFALANESEYMACGILGGVTGNRAHGIIIDDPIKGREDADSETLRDKTYSAYQDDLLTRLVPGGWLCLIQTRWHEDDLAGRILPTGWNGESGQIQCRDGNVWEVLCLQAECQVENDPLGRARGEYLWPEWFTLQHWAQFKHNPRTWSALYQQLPKPLDGNMFKPDFINIVDVFPAGRVRWVRGWDVAATENDGDYTAAPLMGMHEDGYVFIKDLKHGQWGVNIRDRMISATAKADGSSVTQDFPQDPGAAGKAQLVVFAKLVKGYRMVSSPESGDKETRAGGFATEVNSGNVYMLRADWNTRLKEELRPFPNGAYDDIVDGCSRAYNRLNATRGPVKISKSALERAQAGA